MKKFLPLVVTLFTAAFPLTSFAQADSLVYNARSVYSFSGFSSDNASAFENYRETTNGIYVLGPAETFLETQYIRNPQTSEFEPVNVEVTIRPSARFFLNVYRMDGMWHREFYYTGTPPVQEEVEGTYSISGDWVYYDIAQLDRAGRQLTAVVAARFSSPVSGVARWSRPARGMEPILFARRLADANAGINVTGRNGLPAESQPVLGSQYKSANSYLINPGLTATCAGLTMEETLAAIIDELESNGFIEEVL